jgi:hypothetical protein
VLQMKRPMLSRVKAVSWALTGFGPSWSPDTTSAIHKRINASVHLLANIGMIFISTKMRGGMQDRLALITDTRCRALRPVPHLSIKVASAS